MPIEEPKKVEEPFVAPDVSVIKHVAEQPEPREPEKVEIPVIEVTVAVEKVEEPKPAVEEKPEPKRQEI